MVSTKWFIIKTKSKKCSGSGRFEENIKLIRASGVEDHKMSISRRSRKFIVDLVKPQHRVFR